MNKKFSKLNIRLFVFTHDITMVILAWFLAYWLRFNLGLIPSAYLHKVFIFLPFIVTIQATTFYKFGLYRGVWRYASLPDLIRIIKAVLVGTSVIALTVIVSTRLHNVPRSIFPMYAVLLTALLGSSRLAIRLLKQSNYWLNAKGKRVLIIGAGSAGESLVRDLLCSGDSEFTPIAFIDDSRNKQGQEIHGIRVVGRTRDIPKIVEHFAIHLIFIATPTASSANMRRIFNLCEQTNVPIRTLPDLADLVSGRVTIDALREVSITDLLGRDQVTLDWQQITIGLVDQRVLITGGGGSIGSELCRQIAKLQPAEIVVIDNSEFNLYTIEMDLKKHFHQTPFKCYLIDITNRVAVKRVLMQHNPDIVFHAAAYKHVPLLESQLPVAIHNNIIGTKIMAEEVVALDIKKFVLISTDKAVNPTNVMGASKRCAEIFCQNYNNHSTTQFITVRFGNVLDSAGSVVPLFRQQIEEGGPLTVTHPDVTRYFMTIPEACQLILQATVMGQGGEIFVLEMGEKVKIRYLAEQMIRLSGKVIDIIYTGLRPGEKLTEELFHKGEHLVSTQHEKILQASSREWDWKKLNKIMERLQMACNMDDELQLTALFHQLVPEYSAVHFPENLNHFMNEIMTPVNEASVIH